MPAPPPGWRARSGGCEPSWTAAAIAAARSGSPSWVVDRRPPNPFRTTLRGQAALLVAPPTGSPAHPSPLPDRSGGRFSLRDRELFKGERDWWAPHTGLFDVHGNPKPAAGARERHGRPTGPRGSRPGPARAVRPALTWCPGRRGRSRRGEDRPPGVQGPRPVVGAARGGDVARLRLHPGRHQPQLPVVAVAADGRGDPAARRPKSRACSLTSASVRRRGTTSPRAGGCGPPARARARRSRPRARPPAGSRRRRAAPARARERAP